MSLIKLGEAVSINPTDLQPLDKIASDTDLDIENRMFKFARELKVIAPQAKDFLYFTCVMMHAAEASCYNEDGTPKKTSSGEDVSATWEKIGNEGIKWSCNDSNIQPYRNSNRDIFPESELKIAYKNWVGRPLCLDHQSQSVDKIRGVIVDTVYDDKRKRVIALCALDAKNYGDLADKVKTGVATNVSMGTAVGRAVCSECYTVARTEKDFCQHMRSKSCYGEINLDLSPIELSLVVSGADPKAKVKHIIASNIEKAAGLLSNYLQLKEAAKEVSTQDLESIQEDLKKLTNKVEKLTSNLDTEDESDAVGPTRSKQTIEDLGNNETSNQMNVPEAFPTYASDLQVAILGAQTKLASLQDNLSRISNKEQTMTKKNAYFQGTEEPTPGQRKYPVDPANEKTRLLDKNLHGPGSFPNTGDIEGLFPGDEQTKKDLQRLADANERAMFREAALKKAKEQLLSKGYFQGTEEPKPGKTTYTPDALNDKARKEDKNLVGKPPFPGVGKIDGLYGDDEAQKEKLSRASLNARFEKIALPDGRIDKAKSRWVVSANNQQILVATVNQITKGNSDALYDAVATKRFGHSILNRIQTEGFKVTAATLLKSAQAAPPAAPPAAAPPPMEAPPMDEMPPMDDLEPPDDVSGEAGDVPEIVDDLGSLIDEMEGKLSDLEDKVIGPVQEDATELAGIPPAGDEEFAPPEMGMAAPKSASQLQSMRKRVNGMLQEGIGETISVLNKHAKELRTARKIYKETYASMNSKQRDYLNNLTVEAVKDAKAMLADTNKLMAAVVKYAYGTAELQKKAAQKKQIKKAQFKPVFRSSIEAETQEIPVPMPDLDIDNLLCDIGNVEEENMDSDKDDAKVKTQDGKEVELDTEGLTVSLASKEDRAKARIKIAQKGLLGFNELSQQAHPGGSVSAINAGNLDTKPTVPGSSFHVPKDIQSAMQNLANMPPKVRKQAELINTLVSEGKLKRENVDELVAHGVDADAVSYWKKLWGEAKDPEANEFAKKLTQEHAQAKAAEEKADFKGRVKRAYEMANLMEQTGFICKAQIDSQAEDIMNWNDAGFESMKKIINKQSMTKKASVPVVGLLDSGSIMLPASETREESVNIKNLFDNHFQQKGLKF